MSEQRSPEELYEELVLTLSPRPGVTHSSEQPASRFGAAALKVNGRIFAMLVRGALVVKLPSRRVTGLIEQGRGGPFDAGKGSPMKEWLAVGGGSAEEWEQLATEALDFVGSEGTR